MAQVHQDIQAITDRIAEHAEVTERITREIAKVIVGQEAIIERLLAALLADGHVLLEGVPGLAKTMAVRTLSAAIDTKFQRLQFTPDLLPADLIGTMVYNERDREFVPRKGPIFANLILADEINRAPAKVQSALLEAMQERQVTIGDHTFKLEQPFLVLATQNPIEQEGTYPLPEAQIDRFMLKLKIDYPGREEELAILRRMTKGREPQADKVASPAEILAARELVYEIYADESIEQYIVDLVLATRRPTRYGLGDLAGLIEYGASPRASIYLTIAAKAMAFLRGRGYVTPDDVRAIGMDVLRHRVILTYEAEAEEVTTEDVVRKVFETIEVP
ncbi:MAG: AAA family ATPase [Armatimonadota bacterium]